MPAVGSTATLGSVKRNKPHLHRGVKRYVLAQRDGLPYELERTVCRRCGAVLGERALRRAAA
jgi:hypothetical protein